MPRTATDTVEEVPHPVRQLVVLLLALCHEYLDHHVYSAAEEVEPHVMQKVRLVVSSVSTLVKANSKMSSWSALLGGTRQLLLLLDEVNGIAFEEAAACMTEFDLAISGGDENQVPTEQFLEDLRHWEMVSFAEPFWTQ